PYLPTDFGPLPYFVLFVTFYSPQRVPSLSLSPPFVALMQLFFARPETYVRMAFELLPQSAFTFLLAQKLLRGAPVRRQRRQSWKNAHSHTYHGKRAHEHTKRIASAFVRNTQKP
ncbi:MAG: hypothetical protein LBI59_05860, partial [Candidatus Accumulibacter sp.]|nr:hypothetical protein [Accumulibacter sp.]